METKVSCTKCGQLFSKMGIRLHKLHCVGVLQQPKSKAVSIDKVHVEVVQQPKPSAVSIDKVPAEVVQQPKSKMVSIDKAHAEVVDEVHEEESSGDVLGAVIAVFVFIVGIVIFGYLWLLRFRSKPDNLKTASGVTSPAPPIDRSTLMLGVK
jgi:hypothetical protein